MNDKSGITGELGIGDKIRCHYSFATVELTVYNIVGNKAYTKRGEWKDKCFNVSIFHRKYVYEYSKRLDSAFNVTYEVVNEGAVPVMTCQNQITMKL
jgi:hypothetical protein